jgi:hypothetical protein
MKDALYVILAAILVYLQVGLLVGYVYSSVVRWRDFTTCRILPTLKTIFYVAIWYGPIAIIWVVRKLRKS